MGCFIEATDNTSAAFLIGTEKRIRLVELYQLALSFTFILSPMRNAALVGKQHSTLNGMVKRS